MAGAAGRASSANPADGGARHALAAHHALAGDYATALAEWLELMRRDRKFGDDLARRSLLGAFDVLGEGHELTAGQPATDGEPAALTRAGLGTRGLHGLARAFARSIRGRKKVRTLNHGFCDEREA